MRLLITFTYIALLALPVYAEKDTRGFLDDPPIFIQSLPDIPLTGMGIQMPGRGEVWPNFDGVSLRSDGWRFNDEPVQPGLGLRYNVYRIGALYGFGSGWSAGLSIPWQRTKITGEIGNLPATGTRASIGDISLIGKKLIWQDCDNTKLVAIAGLEFPTGRDDSSFDQSNTVTNGYYGGGNSRIPLSWQSGSGTLDGYLGLAYGRSKNRLAWQTILVTKLHSSGDEDVKIGNIFVAAANATYGVSRDLAFALGLTLRTQADDSYPNSPLAVDSPELAGTTQNGTTLYINPSIRYNIAQTVVIGAGVQIPIVKPDDGMVPLTEVSLVFYPSFF